MKAIEISKYVISLTKDNPEENVTNLKLQKILYYLQGYYLALFGEKLFEDQIEPWPYGPVVSDVYHIYKSYGNNSIVLPDIEMNFDYISEIQKKFINRVYAYFRQFSAIKLMEMSHEEIPWKQTYGKSSFIPEDLLFDSFSKSELKDYFLPLDKKEERSRAAHFLMVDYVCDTKLVESSINDLDDVYEY